MLLVGGGRLDAWQKGKAPEFRELYGFDPKGEEVLLTQAGDVGVNPHGALPEQHRQEDARGQVRPGRGGVTPVLVVQGRPVVPAEEPLPGQADRGDRRGQVPGRGTSTG
jgi:hypothetical protein